MTSTQGPGGVRHLEGARQRPRPLRPHSFGQRLLLAGGWSRPACRSSPAPRGGWDHHTKLFKSYKGASWRRSTRGCAALIEDLDQRGLLDTTLVLCLGEFGRTPKINKDAGRDHWSNAMSVLFAGAASRRAGRRGDRRRGVLRVENVLSPENFASTVYTKLGIDPTEHLHTNTGRPVQLVNGGKPIKELFA